MRIDYTIGDDIVAVKTHSRKIFKEGDLFVCKGLRESPCKCKMKEVNVGIAAVSQMDKCGICGESSYNKDGIWWMRTICFRKLDNLVQINEIHELLSQTIEA